MSDELTPREHDAMRAALLAGSRRIKPEGKHRKQIVAGALSVLLVAVIAGGAVTAASLYGARDDALADAHRDSDADADPDPDTDGD